MVNKNDSLTTENEHEIMTVNYIKTYLEAPSVDRPIETLKLGVREVLGAYHSRQEVFVYNLPASTMWLPGNDVSILGIANNVMKFGREVRLNGALGAITVVVFRRHLDLRVIPVRVVNHRLLYLDFLPFPRRIVVVWVHHDVMLCEGGGGREDKKRCVLAAPHEG